MTAPGSVRLVKLFICFVIAQFLDKKFKEQVKQDPLAAWEWFKHFHGYHASDCDIGGVCVITGGFIY